MAETKDWQCGKTLPDRLHHMLINELMCDVTFLVGQKRTPVKAHKFMLSSASPVFYSMFDGPMPELGDVIIPDMEVDTFKYILECIYTDQVDVNVSNVNGLIYGADKYIIEALKTKCTTFLTTSIDDENACAVFQTACQFHLDTLKEEALKFIFKTVNVCLLSKSFLMLSKECVKQIVESNKLNCPEDLLFEQIVEWSKKRCQEKAMDENDEKIRKVLGDLLYLIRFPVMERKYFTLKVSKRSILTPEEINKVFQSYYDDSINLFSKKRRVIDAFKVFRCETNKSSSFWNQEGKSDTIDFVTNSEAMIVGIYVFGSSTYSGKHAVTIDLLQSDLTLASISTELSSIARQEMYCIDFNSPIPIKKDIRYSIRLTMKGPTAFRGKNYKSKVSAQKTTVTFLDSLLPSPNSSSSTGGQIPGIILSSA